MLSNYNPPVCYGLICMSCSFHIHCSNSFMFILITKCFIASVVLKKNQRKNYLANWRVVKDNYLVLNDVSINFRL